VLAVERDIGEIRRMDKKAELSAELRKARGWILGVGILMFVVDMIFIHGVYGDDLPGWFKNELTMYSGIILAVFIGLWWFAQYKPKLCCILALVAFWGIQLWAAKDDPSQLKNGIIIKVFFTLALVNGLKSANRAEVLRKELEQVFG
jgi:hypothetical protein